MDTDRDSTVLEEPEFLNLVDMGYVGLSKPEVVVLPLNEGIPWVEDEQDNWAGDPEQAWA